MQTINYSDRILRRAIGILGILLPILLIVGNQFTEKIQSATTIIQE